MRTKLFCCLVAVTLAVAMPAQSCGGGWLPGNDYPGFDNGVAAMIDWDPDGAGPATSQIVFGGTFLVAGNTTANRIVSYDPSTGVFAPLGDGLNNQVLSLAVLPNGHLVAGGLFTAAGGVAANHIAEWDGTQWTPLGTGHAAAVERLAVTPNGDVFATNNGFSPVDLAVWNGSSWNVVPGAPNFIKAMVTLPNGDLAVGVDPLFSNQSTEVLRWNGSTWSPIGSPFAGPVLSLHTAQNGDLFAAGYFQSVGGIAANQLARWDGAQWQPLGSGLPWSNYRSVWQMVSRANGNLIAVGQSAAGSPNLAEWDGATWTTPTTFPNGVIGAATVAPNGDVLIGGGFGFVGGVRMRYAARYDGANWHPLADGCTGRIRALCTLRDGSLVVAGDFTQIDGIDAAHIARWDGNAWHPLGSGLNDVVFCLEVLANGDLFAGGYFTNAGGAAANHIARWNGSSWQSFGAGLPLPISALIEFEGDVIASDISLPSVIRRWDGATWQPFGPLGSRVVSFAIDHQGTLYISGRMPNGRTQAVGVGYFDGQYWWPRPDLDGSPGPSAVLPDGRLVVGGSNLVGTAGSYGTVAAWDGTSWSGLGCPLQSVRALTVLADGRLVAADLVSSSTVPGRDGIAVWNGTTWHTFGRGPDHGAPGIEAIEGVVQLANGDVAFGGTLRVIDDQANAYLAIWRPDCPATATTFGAGCVGSNGPVELTARSLPWIGATAEAEVSGVPAQCLLVEVFGFTQLSLPLASVLPAAAPGCIAHMTGDYLAVQLPTSGAAITRLPIPNNPAVVGATVHHYVLPFEFTSGGALAQITSSNGLTLHVGTFGL